jgi:gas vesicle protein
MSTHRDNHGYLVSKNAGGFLAGLVMGGLLGSGTMLLLAPRSGKKTRAKIQQEGVELRDQVVGTVEEALAQARGKAHRVAAQVHKQTQKLEQRGQDMLDGQVEIVDNVVEAEKTVAHNMSRDMKKMRRRGRDMVDEQKQVVSDVVEAEKSAAHDLANG